MTATLVHPAEAAAPLPRESHDDVVVPFARLRRADVPLVGGKGANLGEMTAAGLPVPQGFVLTIEAYRQFYEHNALGPRVAAILKTLDTDDPAALERSAAALRQLILDCTLPPELRRSIETGYATLAGERSQGRRVAVRSSATAEDTTQFSFAGMFDSFLNVDGPEALLQAVKSCWASTFGGRVLFYRVKQGLPLEMPVAVVVQRMVNSDKAGVMFTTDPATRDPARLVIEAAWGLGEVVVQGAVTPDRYVLSKPSLAVVESVIAEKEFLLAWSEAARATVRVDLSMDLRTHAVVLTASELRTLGTFALTAEKHYGAPQDLEFAIEGSDIYLTQSRPITTLQSPAPTPPRDVGATPPAALVRGLGASPGRATGAVRLLRSPAEAAAMKDGEILVTHMTSPDWVPIMRRAGAIVTDAGGMTSHAAIVARELGVPCIVGAHDATRVLRHEARVTVDGTLGTVVAASSPPAAASGGESSRGVVSAEPTARLVTATRLYINLAEPARAAELARHDVDGIGLLRAEFMMVEALEHMHPRAFLAAHSPDEFVRRMVASLRAFAQPFAPRPVIYRAMDFRSNEFRNLEGGAGHEPAEANPMIGYRGCFRYTREPDLFALELRALAEVRRDHENLHLMIPFVRTVRELERCLALVDASPLGGDERMERWIMAEVPSVVYGLPAYAALGISGVSIGSNDLTQLILGVDRDSELFGSTYDERDPAVLDAIRSIIDECHHLGITCSICGQAPSVHADYVAQLVAWGIDSISVNPDAIEQARRSIARAEMTLLVQQARAAKRGTGAIPRHAGCEQWTIVRTDP